MEDNQLIEKKEKYNIKVDRLRYNQMKKEKVKNSETYHVKKREKDEQRKVQKTDRKRQPWSLKPKVRRKTL